MMTQSIHSETSTVNAHVTHVFFDLNYKALLTGVDRYRSLFRTHVDIA